MFYLYSQLCKLFDLLSSTDMELRITAGAAIALIYERAREIDEVSFVTLFSYGTSKIVKLLRLYEMCCNSVLGWKHLL